MRGAAALHQIEQLGQRRDARAVDRPLLGKARRIGAARLEPADVVALHLGERERADRRAFGVEEFPVRTARVIRIEPAVVADDQHVVPGHREIELERRDADRERGLEGRERVLGRKAARAAMALQVERVRGRRQAEPAATIAMACFMRAV